MNAVTPSQTTPNHLTVDQVKNALPDHLRGSATQDFTDKLNQISSDPIFAEQVQNNFISYASVLREGRHSLDQYMDAVQYVSFKLMGFTNQDAYQATFPDRYARLVGQGLSPKDISAYVAAYNKGKLVNQILEQSLVPLQVLNAHHRQAAITRLADLMHTAESEKVQSDSAIGLLGELAKLEKGAGVQVNNQVNVTVNNGIDALMDSMNQLARSQVKLIESGAATTKQVAHQGFANAIDVTPESEDD